MKRVLIVDDSPIGRMLVAGVLAAVGREDLQIEQVGSGEDALIHLNNATPDIVFTDLHMRDMSGLTLIRKARKAGFEMPIVAVTMEEDATQLAALLAAGATLVLSKHDPSGALQASLSLLDSAAS